MFYFLFLLSTLDIVLKCDQEKFDIITLKKTFFSFSDTYKRISIFVFLKDVSVFSRIMANSTQGNTTVNKDNSGTNKSCARFWMFSKREKSGVLFDLGQIGWSAGQIDNIG